MFNKKYTLMFCMIFLMAISCVSANFGFDNLGDQEISINISNGTVFNHNDLEGLQGGTTNEYYHIRQSWFDELTSDIFNWITQSDGDARYYELTDFSISDYYLKSNPFSFYNYTTLPNPNSTYDINPLWLRSGNNIYLNASGNVGIGTTTPTTAKLVISGYAAEEGLDLASTDQYANLRVIRNSLSSTDKDMYIGYGSGSSSELHLYSNNAETLTVTSGNVGIGTSSPNVKLQVAGDIRVGNITDDNGATAGYGDYLRFSGGDDWSSWNSDNSDPIWMARYNSGSDESQLRINVGDGSGTTDKIELGTTISGTWTPRFVVRTDGNVGIGTTSPSYPLEVNRNVSGISIYTSGNISATGFITRTNIYDKSKNVWDYIKDADYYEKDGEIDHSKYYGFVANISSTDYSKPINETYEEEVCEDVVVNMTVEKCNWIENIFMGCEDVIEEQTKTECHNETKERVTYPYTKIEDGVSLEDEINLLRQAVYELKIENDNLKSRMEVLENAK